MELTRAVSALAALAQENRLQVFRWLVERGPEGACPGEIVESLGIAPATLSFHLKALHHARLVRSQRSGRHIVYSADFNAVRELIGFLTESCCDGRPGRCLPADLFPESPAQQKVCR
jgi:ArsR family transcriptional regulator, arsenate/arsenite/antimonite-responsive transcriptional repressor